MFKTQVDLVGTKGWEAYFRGKVLNVTINTLRSSLQLRNQVSDIIIIIIIS
jgi:hypothetical protein